MESGFQDEQGLFKPTMMFFRMCNSPATFQAMDDIFMMMIDNPLVIVYMDDISSLLIQKKNWNG
jgi:hypothetical protein